MKQLQFAIFLLTASAIAQTNARGDAPVPSIIPRPQLVERRPGTWTFAGDSTVVVPAGNEEVRRIGQILVDSIRFERKITLPLIDEPKAPAVAPDSMIRLRLLQENAAVAGESYTLIVEPDVVELAAKSPLGLFNGVQSLRHMIIPYEEFPELSGNGLPIIKLFSGVNIVDAPRFRHRGMLLDCGRHFMTKDFVKRYIDLLAYHKMNVLHWHLTEDQGWRIEIKKYPELTRVGAWRKATRDSEQPRDSQGRYGGFYTHDDIREIVAYAQSRYITIIPEIEMPGHSLAALAARPDLTCTGGPFEVGTEWGVIDDVYCAGNEKTFEFLQDVLTEVIALFPGEYIHIGGDECPKARWKKCAKCQKRMREEKLKDEHELQSYFIRRIEKFLNARGRRLIGWDEILEGGLAPNATVQAWQSMDAAATAARTGHDVIVSPTSHCYLDYPQHSPDADPLKAFAIDKVYAFDPMPKGLEAAHQGHILGIEGNIWTERAPQNLVDDRVFPRLCAIAEIGWSPAEPRDWNEFRGRLRAHLPRLEKLGVTYFIDPPRFTSGDSPFAEQTKVVLECPVVDGRIVYTLDGSDPTAQSPGYSSGLSLTKTTMVRTRLILHDGRMSEIVSRLFRRAEGDKAEQGASTQPTSKSSAK